jgi:hypothetical protein
MMVLRFSLLILLLFINVPGVSYAEDAGFVGPEPLRENRPVNLERLLMPGEKLTYIAKWSGFPAGEVTTYVWPRLREFDEHPVFMFEMMIESNDFISIFFPVRSQLRSLTDSTHGWSYLMRRRVHEGDYAGNDRVFFDYTHRNAEGRIEPQAQMAFIRAEEIEEAPPRSIPGYLCDPLGFAWYMRGIPLEKRGDMASVLIADRFATGLVSLQVTGNEVINIPGLGSFACVVIRPKATHYGGKGKLLDVEGQALFWLEKNTRILLRAEADVPVGQVGVTLIAHENTALADYALPVTPQQ